MEVDHFNPKLTGPARHRYANLLLAARHCNGAKSDIWPSRSERLKGLRLINPCEELDYGFHIFEHPITHRLVGVTPAGDYHITACDLNATHFVEERKQRAEIHTLLFSTKMTLKNHVTSLPSKEAAMLKEVLKTMIPLIPYLPVTHPKYRQELLLVQALNSINN